MFEINHGIVWLKKAGFRKWALCDGSGQVLLSGSRRECLNRLDTMRRQATRRA